MNISAEDFLKHMKEAVAIAERIAQQRDEALVRLVAVEAERDAARAEAESTWRCFHCGFCTTDRAKALAHFGDQDEEMALCRWWTDSTDAERVQALQDAIEEQNAAQAGEARAVEALRDFVMYAQGDLGSRNLDGPERHGLAEGYWDGVQAVVDRLQALIDSLSQPALDWLAQQRAEAAAVEAERIAGECHNMPGLFPLREHLRDRAANLRAGKGGDA